MRPTSTDCWPPSPSSADPLERAAAFAEAGGSGVLVKVLPYPTVVIAAFVPLAAGIYLLTSLAWSLAERKFSWRRCPRKVEKVS
jgi:hypothetical protein